MLNTVGVFIVPSMLVVKLVTMAFDEPIENSYNTGKPDGKRAARSEPEMLVVPKLKSLKGTTLGSSENSLPLESQAVILIATPLAGSVPEMSEILMVLRELT